MIEEKLQATLQPLYVELTNESSSHGRPPSDESHFKLMIVSALFEGKSLLEQQRLVYGILKEELKESIHALSLKTFTPEQWKSAPSSHTTPRCKGGSKIQSE